MQFCSLLADSRRSVVFTGAGISTEPGIPDFRGPNGLWTKMQPIDFRDFINSAAVRQTSWERWFKHGRHLLEAAPNVGHYAVARLVEAGKVAAVITQNIDNLHQASGVPSHRVIELHGNTTYAKCLGCGTRFEMDAIGREFSEIWTGRAVPRLWRYHQSRDHLIRPDDAGSANAPAQQEALACDLFIILGSSLTVYPAAGFPSWLTKMAQNW